jgi:hypothetical protein
VEIAMILVIRVLGAVDGGMRDIAHKFLCGPRMDWPHGQAHERLLRA